MVPKVGKGLRKVVVGKKPEERVFVENVDDSQNG